MPLFRNAIFYRTIARLVDLPSDSLSEVAFAGRSNCGKSSAINALADHTRLAFVSKTPGRTQNLNYFRVADGRYLVDLPGYGFARAPAEIRAQWGRLLAPYLRERPALRGLVLIMDSRHPLTVLDRQLLDWFAPTGKPIHVLLSKADKLSHEQRLLTLRRVTSQLGEIGSQCSAQLFSSLRKSGLPEAENVLGDWLGLTGVAPDGGSSPAAAGESPEACRASPDDPSRGR